MRSALDLALIYLSSRPGASFFERTVVALRGSRYRLKSENRIRFWIGIQAFYLTLYEIVNNCFTTAESLIQTGGQLLSLVAKRSQWKMKRISQLSNALSFQKAFEYGSESRNIAWATSLVVARLFFFSSIALSLPRATLCWEWKAFPLLWNSSSGRTSWNTTRCPCRSSMAGGSG